MARPIPDPDRDPLHHAPLTFRPDRVDSLPNPLSMRLPAILHKQIPAIMGVDSPNCA
jgi:hypothetical protein